MTETSYNQDVKVLEEGCATCSSMGDQDSNDLSYNGSSSPPKPRVDTVLVSPEDEDGQAIEVMENRVREYVQTVRQCIIALQRSVAITPRATRSSISGTGRDTGATSTPTSRFAVGGERSSGLILHHGHRPPLSREVAHRFQTSSRLLEALRGLGECVQEAYHFYDGSIKEANKIVQEVARIPNLIMAILMMQNDNEMQQQLLSLPIMRRVCLCKESVRPVTSNSDSPENSRVSALDVRNTCEDSWLLDLLHSEGLAPTKKRVHQERAVHYLEMISSLTVRDYVGVLISHNTEGRHNHYNMRRPSDDDVMEAFEKERQELFFAVASLKLLVPHLYALKTNEMERAALTPVVQWALNDAIRHPFLVGLVFCDICFHAALLTATRNLILLDIDSVFGISDSNVNDWGFYIAISFGPASVLYFAFRLVGDILSTAQVSWQVFRQNLFYRWTVVEIATVTMVVGSIVALLIHDESRNSRVYFSYQAFTLGLLWLKVLSFLQVLNRKLAAYVLAIFKILHDVWLFMLIILVMVFAFGDMFYTIYSVYRSDEGANVCTNFDDDTALGRIEDRAESPFCKSSRWIGYLGIYRVFVGDLTVNDFDANGLTTALFVLLTFFAIILLLNMLIALVLESYELSLVKSDSLFGRARIALVAKGLLLEEILLPRARGSRCRGCSVFMRLWAVFVVAVIAIYLIGISVYVIVDPNGERDRVNVLAAIVCIVATFLLLYFVTLGLAHMFAGQGWTKNLSGGARFFHWTFRCGVAVPVTFITLTLLGAKNPTKREVNDINAGTNMRRGIKSTSATFARFEKRIELSNQSLQNEITALGKTLAERDDQLEFRLRTMEQRILESVKKP